MKKILISSSILFSLFAIASCCKEGANGDATIVVFLKHHGNVIPNNANHVDTVWVKFNAKDSPGSGTDKYDTYFVGEAGEDHVHCHDLKCGDYFLFGTGLDTTIGMRVSGGAHIKIKHKERKDEIDTDLAVTE